MLWQIEVYQKRNAGITSELGIIDEGMPDHGGHRNAISEKDNALRQNDNRCDR